MQNDKICSEIVSTYARTKTDANLLLSEVEILEYSLFKIGEGDFESTLKKSIRAKTASAILQAVGNGSRKETLTTLKEKINSLKFVGLKIAFEPTLEITDKLAIWIKSNLGEGIAMDITVDSRIIGGAVIEYKGKIRNFTLADQLTEYFLTK